jgi:cytochrome b
MTQRGNSEDAIMARQTSSSSFKLPMQVWDLPTRLFHWLLVATVLVSYASVTLADGAYAGTLMKVHVWSGETALGLLIFRLIWGVIGSETARFSHFLRHPRHAVRHLAKLREQGPDTQIGHNEAGGWMVVALLALLTVQVGSGLFSNDDGNTEGPLAQFVSKQTSDLLSDLHGLNFNFLIAAVAVHVIAIALYVRIKGHNLVLPMISGKKRLPAATRAPRIASTLLAVLAAAASAAITLAVARL